MYSRFIRSRAASVILFTMMMQHGLTLLLTVVQHYNPNPPAPLSFDAVVILYSITTALLALWFGLSLRVARKDASE